MKRRTPQEKKLNSYLHDGRNMYGENDKGSRKIIPRNKAWDNRSQRRAVHQALHKETRSADPETTKPIPRKRWRKVYDGRLAEWVATRFRRREVMGINEPGSMPDSEIFKEAVRRLRRDPRNNHHLP